MSDQLLNDLEALTSRQLADEVRRVERRGELLKALLRQKRRQERSAERIAEAWSEIRAEESDPNAG